jgi:hypothetical protein
MAQGSLVLGLTVELHDRIRQDRPLLGGHGRAPRRRRDDAPQKEGKANSKEKSTHRTMGPEEAIMEVKCQKYTPNPPEYVCAFLYESGEKTDKLVASRRTKMRFRSAKRIPPPARAT